LRSEATESLEQAIHLLRQVLKETKENDPESAEVHFHLGRMLSLQRGEGGERLEESCHHFKRAMMLRREWIPFDSRLATAERINDVLLCYTDAFSDARASPTAYTLQERASDTASVRAALNLHNYTAGNIQVHKAERQYFYFCTSKASKLSTLDSSAPSASPTTLRHLGHSTFASEWITASLRRCLRSRHARALTHSSASS